MNLDKAASIDDLRALAKARVPRFAFDFLDGGAEDEHNLRRNREAFAGVTMTPRYLVDVTMRKVETKLFGHTYSAPFGIAPIGMLNIVWPGSDLAFARLAARENIPHVASTAASTPLERIAEAADGRAWFQLYVSSRDEQTDTLLDRAAAAGYEILLVTVDVPVPGKRDRDTRNGFAVPFRFTPSIVADLALHPRWTLSSLSAGRPDLANFRAQSGKGGGAQSLAALQATMIKGALDWADLKRIRDRWKGKLLVKGIMHADDARRCIRTGCDGVVVSNHGGRQVPYGLASVEVLPAVRKAVGDKGVVLLDSGIRRGGDMVRAKALGADFCLLGRSFAYGAGAGGEAGVRRAFDIISAELSWALGQLGQPDFGKVDGALLTS